MIDCMDQGIGRLVESLRQKMKIPESKLGFFLQDGGNTVSATIPMAIEEMKHRQKIQAGQLLMLVGFGVGYSWAGCIARI